MPPVTTAQRRYLRSKFLMRPVQSYCVEDGTECQHASYTSMPNNTEAERSRAERIFHRREQLKADAPKATHDYHAAQQRVIERTRKLREERLAREAEAEALNSGR
jgi:hypothetical protein